MWAVIGILSALLRRNQTGEGCEVNTSLFETALSWMCMATAMYLASGNVPKRVGSENGGMAPYKAYQATDGWVVIAAANDNLFRRFAQAVGHPEWPDDPEMNSNSNRVRNRAKVNALVADVIATQPRQYWIDALAAATGAMRAAAIARRGAEPSADRGGRNVADQQRRQIPADGFAAAIRR